MIAKVRRRATASGRLGIGCRDVKRGLSGANMGGIAVRSTVFGVRIGPGVCDRLRRAGDRRWP
ncbi:MAG: hypothetical protein BroJett029_24160 [Alphaproteobacteria bacterium]|nr:MAG: hypothetical protein BroJett029_24160 [Alphaproteobacteria bacterium]